MLRCGKIGWGRESMYIDSHCHLDEVEGLDGFLNTLNNDDEMTAVVTLGCDVGSSEAAVKIAEKSSKVFCAVGFQPEYAAEFSDADIAKIEALLNNKKVVAIGEVGLDFYWTRETERVQKEMFVRQIELADKHKLPICIHCRNAAPEMFEILKSNKRLLKNGFVLHCFSEAFEWVKPFVELGAFISFAGNSTFKSYDKDVLKAVPADRILMETDSPFLAPVPLRGQKNTPINVKLIAKNLAEVRGEDFETLTKQIEENTKSFYKL